MSIDRPSDPDPTTETDEASLERALQADLRPTSLKQKPGASEHSSGHAAAADVERESPHGERKAHRKPRPT